MVYRPKFAFLIQISVETNIVDNYIVIDIHEERDEMGREREKPERRKGEDAVVFGVTSKSQACIWVSE